jgi:dipeptidyl aminopeptidase/acylaminoacyl peptidase
MRTVFLFFAAIFAGLLSVALQAQAPAPSVVSAPKPVSLIPLADFASVPFISQPRLSPDGTILAGIMSTNGRQGIVALNLFNKAESPVKLAIPDGSQAAWIRWVNNDHLIVGLHALLPVASGDRWTITRLISVNRKTGKVSKILWDSGGQNASDVIWVAHDGSPNILVSAQNSIYLDEEFWPAVHRVNVETGSKSVVIRGKPTVMDWFADGSGNVRAGSSYNDDSRKFRLLYRGEGGGLFRTVDAADSRKQETLTSPFLFIPGTDNALIVQENDDGSSTVNEIDLKTQQDLRTVYAAPPGSEIDRVFTSVDEKTLLGVSYSGNQSGVSWIDPALNEVQAAIDKSVPGKLAQIVSMSADRTRLLVLIDRPDSPGALYFFDLANAKLVRIAFINEALGTRPLNPVKMIRYKARDGLEIEAVLTLPRDRQAKNLPVIMLPHGGPWGQDTLTYDYWAQFLASRGYAVIQPNFRGSIGYGSAFVRKGEGQMGLAMQDDITDGLAWAVKEGIADPKRACIVGASYGGYAAMWGVAKDPELYRCAVSIAGVANLRREVNDFGNSYMGGKYRDDWKRMSPDFAAVSPFNAVNRIKAPLLLIHGKKDIIVDFAQSNAMFGNMRGAGKDVELVMLPEADHQFSRQSDRVSLLTALENFLLKHNPPDPAPMSK